MLDIACALDAVINTMHWLGIDILDHNGETKCHAEYSYLFISRDEGIEIGVNGILQAYYLLFQLIC